MLLALRALVGDAMEGEWARERVRKLLNEATEDKPAPAEMTVKLGGVPLTVSGQGVVLVIAPGLNPSGDGTEK
jgi:hypothetical protein